MVTLLQSEGKIYNRYPDSNSLAHKDSFAQMTNLIQTIDSDSYEVAPITFTFPSQFEQNRLQEYMSQNKSAVFIVKPQAGSQGSGINIFKEIKDLPVSIDSSDVVI